MDKPVGIFGLLFAAAIAARIYFVYREIGRLPVILKNGDTAHDFVHKVLIGILLLEAINIIAFRFQILPNTPSSTSYQALHLFLEPLDALNTPGVNTFGLVLAYCGLAWSVAAQHQMGKDWRIGIDTGDDISVVSHGLYARSRHPIYLGFMAVCMGLLFAVPTIISLVSAVLAIIVLSIQARLEEEFLLSHHGDAYGELLARTRRWI